MLLMLRSNLAVMLCRLGKICFIFGLGTVGAVVDPAFTFVISIYISQCYKSYQIELYMDRIILSLIIYLWQY